MKPSVQELYALAKSSREKAYCPYSHVFVGAAIRTQSGHIYGGCNVENSSYGATICAERVAIQKAISEEGPIKITEIVVLTDAQPAWPPCGMCRQVIAEFAAPNTPIFLTNLKGECTESTLGELLPLAFTPAHMGK